MIGPWLLLRVKHSPDVCEEGRISGNGISVGRGGDSEMEKGPWSSIGEKGLGDIKAQCKSAEW